MASYPIVLLVAQLLTGGLGSPATVDPCVSAIPETLSRRLLERFPGYRLPRREDESPDISAADRQSARETGLGGCFTVERGDFDGDGRQDFALLLPRAEPSVAEPKVQLVVALNRGASWKLEALPNWFDAVGRAYVSSAKAGVYRRTASMPDPLEPGERRRLSLKRQGVCAGVLESFSVVYARDKDSWTYVWVSN